MVQIYSYFSSSKTITYRRRFGAHVALESENQELWWAYRHCLCSNLQIFGTNVADFHQFPPQNDTRCLIFVLHRSFLVALRRRLLVFPLSLLSLPLLAFQLILLRQPRRIKSTHIENTILGYNNEFKRFKIDLKKKKIKLRYDLI